jgi:hypothetical protein
MSDEPVFRSRKNSENAGATRGLGSGFAQNQRVVGAADPAEAARLAALSPEQAADEQARLEKIQGDLDAMREDVLMAIVNEQWSPDTSDWPETPSTIAQWKALLSSQPTAMVVKWHGQSKAAIDEQIDDEELDLREGLAASIQLDPDDPAYDPVRDKARRKLVEDQLKPLDFEEMVFRGYTVQVVPIRENLSVTFRTINTQHGLWLEYMMSLMPETSYQHQRHTFSLLQVAACLEKVNTRASVGDVTKFVKSDQRDEFIAVVEERMEALGTMPSVISDELIVQYVWFTSRVRKCLSGDLMRKVGNS